MPPPVLLLAGPAAAAAAVGLHGGPAAVGGGAYYYYTLFSWPVLMGLSDAAIAVLLGRLVWRCYVPEWVRNDVSMKGLLRVVQPPPHDQQQQYTNRQKKSHHNNRMARYASARELSTVASVVEKLQALFVTVSEKLSRQQRRHLSSPARDHDHDDDDAGTNNITLYLRAAVLAHIQLTIQLRKLYPAVPVLTVKADVTTTRSANNNNQDADEIVVDGPAIDYAVLKTYLDYAVAAYETDSAKLPALLGGTAASFVVLQHNTLIEGGSGVVPPGHVGHYVAVSHQRKVVLVGVRGTSSFEDLITDCCGKAVRFGTLDVDEYCYGNTGKSSRIEVRAAQPPIVRVDDDERGDVEVLSGHEERVWIEEQKSDDDDDEYAVRCHEGIMISAKRLVDHIQRYIVQYCLQRPDDKNNNDDDHDGRYQCLLCGHSLGAGVATLAAMILRARFPSFQYQQQQQQQRRPRLLLQVVAFAPPPVLDHDSAIAAAPWVLSIVNNTDLIPRLSMANLAVFLEHMRTISDKLAEKGLQPKDVQSTIALIRKLTQPLEAVTGERDLLMSHDEVKMALRHAHQTVQLRDPDHLFVAGRVLLFVDDVIQLHRRQHSHHDTVDGDDRRKYTVASCEESQRLVRCVDTDGCEPLLRHLEIDLVRMASDHVSASYYAKIEALAKLRVNNSGLS